MKFVPTHLLQPGMKLERDLYLFNTPTSGVAMLTAGTLLTAFYIQRLRELGLAGAYIHTGEAEDDPTRKMELTRIFRKDEKKELLGQLRSAYDTMTQTMSSRILAESISQTMDVAQKLVSTLIGNQHIMVSIEDLRLYDDELYNHSIGVAVLAISMGMSFSLLREELNDLALSALLHDIGKTLIPQEILKKTSRLSSEEYEIAKLHAAKGADFLAQRKLVGVKTLMGVRHHHEHYDGGGYPNGLRGEAIPIFSRIISVADVFDALTSARSYRSPASPQEAVEYIMGASGKLFDIDVVNSFMKRISPFPVGSFVRLSNGESAIVIRQNREHPLRPVIRLQSTHMMLDLYRIKKVQNLVIEGVCETGEPEKS